MVSQIDLGFSQRPGWKDKGNFNSVSCPGVSLERSRTGPSHCLKRVKVTTAGDRTLPHGMWLWLLTQQYQRYSMFSLPTLFDLALCWLWPLFPSTNNRLDPELFNNFAWSKSLAYFCLFYFSSLVLPFDISLFGTLLLWVQVMEWEEKGQGADTCSTLGMCISLLALNLHYFTQSGFEHKSSDSNIFL